MGKVCKVEKVRSTFHTFHDYLNFYGEKKDDRLLTIYKPSDEQLIIFGIGNLILSSTLFLLSYLLTVRIYLKLDC